MLTGEIRCTRCETVLATTQTESYREMCLALQPLLVACHAAPPHCPHQLEFSIQGDGEELDSSRNLRSLHIRCLSSDCLQAGIHVETSAPLELVGALTLLFHTSHEGHPLELQYGDRRWVSPPKP